MPTTRRRDRSGSTSTNRTLGISVAYLESGAVILSCVLLSLGVLIILFSYPVSWRLVGMVIQRVLDRRIARGRTQSAIP